MRLTRNFTLDEFEASETAARRGIDNQAPPEVVNALMYTAQALEVVRRELGHPIIITSGYRSPELNAAIGGSANSQHMKGQAADIIVPGFGRPIEVCRRILEAGIVFDQLIHEFGGWTHVSFVPSGARMALLTIDRHGTRRGLHEARR